MAKTGGLLRTLRDAVNAHVIPVAHAHGFASDPSARTDGAWNDHGYHWRLVAMPSPGIVLRLQISTGVSRDPALHATWAAFDIGEEPANVQDAATLLTERIDVRGDDFARSWIMARRAAKPISLSPWRSAAGNLSLLRGLDRLGKGPLRFVVALLVYPFILLWIAISLPWTIASIFLDIRWLNSPGAKTGARQDKIARRFARRLDVNIVRRMPEILDDPANARLEHG